jgi:hypothetical protein
MSERKVISKYYPPDFKPDGVPGRKKKGTPQLRVRMMLPMSIRCKICGEYLYQGKKFNSRKETVWDEDYLGLKIFRFYLKCPTCAGELTFKTDPKNSGYVTEHNCSRNFEAWRDPSIEEERVIKSEQEAETDAMKQLETKSHITKQEMEDLDDLDEIKTINARNNMVSVDDLLAKHGDHYKYLEEMEEEEIDVEEELEEFMKPSVKRIVEDTIPKPVKRKKESKVDFLEMEEPVVIAITPILKKPSNVQKKKSLVAYDDDE